MVANEDGLGLFSALRKGLIPDRGANLGTKRDDLLSRLALGDLDVISTKHTLDEACRKVGVLETIEHYRVEAANE